MVPFRVLLGLMTLGVLAYTGVVGTRHGWNLLPVFFGDILAMSWPGQFNLDFSCFLLLSGLWLAWRHHGSAGGLALGALGAVGGIVVLAPYLLVVSVRTGGDMKRILLGDRRAASA